MSSKKISVIVPSYNPDADRLRQTIGGLKNQTLAFGDWELIIIDNNSTPKIEIDLRWHPNHQIVTEPKQGLTSARLKGFETASGQIIMMVDDDNILNAGYLENTLEI